MGSTPPTIDPRDEAFLREVDEAYREDRLKELLRRYWRLGVVLIGGGLVLLGAFLWWQEERGRRANELSERFSTALGLIENGSASEAAEPVAALEQAGNAGYRSLAALTAAGMALADDDTGQAVARLKAVADDPKAPRAIRDAALLKYVSAGFDGLAPEEVVRLLQPYLEDGNPWFPVAGELAGLAQLKAGKPGEAGPLFRRVALDADAPPSLRARAEQMAASLGEDMTALATERENAVAAQALLEAAADGGAGL